MAYGQFDNEGSNWGGAYSMPVSEAPAETRASFIRQTYGHLAGAVAALVGIELIAFSVLPASTLESITTTMFAGLGGYAWLVVLGLFFAVSTVAQKWAMNGANVGMQYAGLGLYVVAQAAILLPLLTIATAYTDAGMDASPFGLIPTAAVITALIVGGLTAFVFVTGANFNWLGGILMVAGLGFAGLIVASILFGFTLGLAFIVFGVVLMSAGVLYQTSNIMHEYPVGSHVAASLALFASIAMLFWYVLQLLMSLQRE